MIVLSMHVFSFLSLSAIVCIAVASTDIFIAGLPIIANEFGIAQNHIHSILTFGLYGFIVGCSLVGICAERYGTRRFLNSAIVAYCFASFFISFSHSYKMILFGRFIQGYASAIAAVISSVIVVDACGQEKASKYLNVVGSLIPLTIAIAPIIGGALISVYGWRATFFASGAASILPIISILISCPHVRPKHDAKFSTTINNFKILIKDRWLGVLSMVPGILIGCAINLQVRYSFILIKHKGFAPLQFSLLMALGPLINGIVSFFIHKIRKDLGDIMTIKLGVIISFITSLSMIYVFSLDDQSTFLLMLVAICNSVSIAFTISPGIMFLFQRFSSIKATVSAIMTLIRIVVISAIVAIMGLMQNFYFAVAISCVLALTLKIVSYLKAHERNNA